MTDDPEVAATRASYDATANVYARTIGTEISDSIEAALDRSVLQNFVALFDHGQRVADLGCGPGRVGALLAASGIDVVGIDLSFGMLAIGRQAHPDLRFADGDLGALPLGNRSLDGAVCWYSVIHTEPDRLESVFREVARVIVPGGRVLFAFQEGSGERVHRTDIQGTPVVLTNYRHGADDFARRLRSTGFHVQSCVVREPEFAHESTAQAFVVAQLMAAD